MAARRLITILIALLVVSSFAAALAPQESAEEESSTTSEPATTTRQGSAGEGEVVRERISPEPKEPRVIELNEGDQLELLVEVGEPTEVRIAGLGRTAFATPGDPARFDLLLRGTGEYAVTVADGEAVGRLAVS